MKGFSTDQVFATVATCAVGCGLLAGFWVVGTPGYQRLVRVDQQRLGDLSSIANNLYRQAQDKKSDFKLPESLPTSIQAKDPLTKQPYGYTRLTEKTYQLCAEFATDSSTYPLQNSPDADQGAWTHPKGKHCFDFDVTEQPKGIFYGY
jgi:hypothetical protein